MRYKIKDQPEERVVEVSLEEKDGQIFMKAGNYAVVAINTDGSLSILEGIRKVVKTTGVTAFPVVENLREIIDAHNEGGYL